MKQVCTLLILAFIASLTTNNIKTTDIKKKVEYENPNLYGIGKKLNNKISWTPVWNVEYYSVQKSVDGMKWVEVAKVKARHSGDSEKYYSVVDTKPYDRGYYRVISYKSNSIGKSNQILIDKRHKRIPVRA